MAAFLAGRSHPAPASLVVHDQTIGQRGASIGRPTVARIGAREECAATRWIFGAVALTVARAAGGARQRCRRRPPPAAVHRRSRCVRLGVQGADSLEAAIVAEDMDDDVQAEEPTSQGDRAWHAAESATVRRLRAMVLVKEIRMAITSGEFALRLRGAEQPGSVDYGHLCDRLKSFSERLQRHPPDEGVMSEGQRWKVQLDLKSTSNKLQERLIELTRRRANSASQEAEGGERSAGAEGAGDAKADEAALTATPGEAVSSTARAKSFSPPGPLDPNKFLLYLREDQTVDVDAAQESGVEMSTDLTERLRGNPHNGDSLAGGSGMALLAKELDERVRQKEQGLAEAKNELEKAKALRASLIGNIRKQPPSRWLLSKAEADVPDPERCSKLRELADADKAIRGWEMLVILANIDLLFEQSAAALEARLEGASLPDWDNDGFELKSQVIELSWLEQQAARCRQFSRREVEAVTTSGLDMDELRMAERQLARLANRLGMQGDVIGQEGGVFQILQSPWSYFVRSLPKARRAATFCARGVGLLCRDLQHAFKLGLKVVFLKYTLEVREAKLCYRAVKDIFVLIPFLVILLIPLSPPGHVLVFSFIMKVYPDFFPSPFTERRQNAMRIYNAIKPSSERLNSWL